ncbi:leukocyte elastase inhibitor [Hippoglossus stenolepis]|uniref:leukocyte elastase inhibitor n=1 Tax=Hippoglossus stenolepis TaxID=195615 RepID=UPI001FAEEA0E|nr:leukocyte elastase inhibitor [Hippoglossus stenolepis]
MASSAPLSKANTSFCLDLFKKLSDNDKAANVFYSPFSISSALAMVMLGARGNTHTQMSEVLSFCEAVKTQPGGAKQKQMQQQEQMQQQVQMQKSLKAKNCLDDIHADFSKLLKTLNKAGAPYSLSVANRLYGEQSYQFVEDFIGETRKHYNAELESVDFKTGFEAARLKINGWVEEQTQDKIKDLLLKGTLHDMTRMVLVNAIYFKGDWNKQFEESATRDAQFRLNKNESKQVKMMYQNTTLPLGLIAEPNCQVLEMPYKEKELSMLIFLPMDIDDSSTGLEKLEKELTYDNFVEWTHSDRLSHSKVEVGLPRFKMEESYDMGGVLVSMGMVDAFDSGMCDFSGMSPSNDLVLSKVIHKAFVEVNEEGTEAAAATAITVGITSVSPRARFIADHPFLFFIRHNHTKSVLFAGRYCSPQ